MDNKRLYEIDWSSYQHAYGKADDIPEYLASLFSNDTQRVYFAIGKLDSSLCHQHIGVAPALLPAFPFLIEALHKISQIENLGLLLEFFRGISSVTLPPDPFYSIRALNLSWTRIPSITPIPTEKYIREIRQELLSNRDIFNSFLSHENDYVFEYASIIMSNFTENPTVTAKELQVALLSETKSDRREQLYLGFSQLRYEGKVDYLRKAFDEEIDISTKTTIAIQIAYEMKNHSPFDVIDLLSDQMLTIESNLTERHKIEFFQDLGISLALARPDKYENILKNYIDFLQHEKFIIDGTYLLAFALCWNEKPDFSKLTPLQLRAIEIIYQKSWQGKHTYPSSDSFWYFFLPTRQEEMKAFLLRHKN